MILILINQSDNPNQNLPLDACDDNFESIIFV